MRIDARTRGADVMQGWASGLDLPFVAVLRESQAYVRCIENGLSLFDLPAPQVEADLAQWQPILQWLHPVLQPDTKPVPEAVRTTSPRTPPLRTPVLRNTRPAATKAPGTVVPLRPHPARPPARPVRAATPSPVSRWLDALPIPRFLQRTP
jgi:chromosome partitioning protein